jgi:D-citramalate synthase
MKAVESQLTHVSKRLKQFRITQPAQQTFDWGKGIYIKRRIHADGDSKKNLYFNNLMPERFWPHRPLALV